MSRSSKQQKTRWAAIRTGSGKTTGYIELFFASGQWMTVPGVSRVTDADGCLNSN